MGGYRMEYSEAGRQMVPAPGIWVKRQFTTDNYAARKHADPRNSYDIQVFNKSAVAVSCQATRNPPDSPTSLGKTRSAIMHVMHKVGRSLFAQTMSCKGVM